MVNNRIRYDLFADTFEQLLVDHHLLVKKTEDYVMEDNAFKVYVLVKSEE